MPAIISVTKTAKEKFQKGEIYQENGAVEKMKEDVHFAGKVLFQLSRPVSIACLKYLENISELDTVKKRFESGLASDETEKSEKVPTDLVRASEIGNIKATFEQGLKNGKDDTKMEAKRQKIEAEFKRIKREQKLMREREEQEAKGNAGSQSCVSAFAGMFFAQCGSASFSEWNRKG